MLKERALKLDGLFILRDSVAPASLVPGLELENGYIKADIHMRTNIQGLFAAGDCTGKPHQYMRAAGQGQTAALMAVEYLDATGKDDEKRKENENA
jgi:thioredoxin reductase (NADPH)